MTRTCSVFTAAIFWFSCTVCGVWAADIVKNGRALGAIWIKDESGEFIRKQEAAAMALNKMGGNNVSKTSDKKAAEYLADYIEKMTGIKPEIKNAVANGKPDAKQPAIIMGELALEMGLEPPPKTLSFDGYRLKTKGNHLLMAGESGPALMFAATHFLEHFGYRWLTFGKLGEAIPQLKTISLDGFAASETPDFLFRNVWGADLERTRLGGIDLPNQHNWPFITKAKYFDSHPEYFALCNGQRVTSGLGGTWVCTTHPDVIEIFAQNYIEEAKKGAKAASISPPDGRSFCECERCKAMDVQGYVEPSNGALCMSDRYVAFFDAVARRVKKQAPNFILSFYAYSDYTLPPKNIIKVSDNLCVWITTIRFCRFHSFSNLNCEAAARYKDVVERWSAMGIKTACYDYNYNLAEVTVPISKISYFRDRIPFLKKTGCLGINLESMSAAHLYAPHTYLAARLMWDADADANAILDDFYGKFAGKAAPHIKNYWERIDRAVTAADTHCGSFYGIHKIWTPELIADCQKDLDAAAKTADTEPARARVAMTQAGLDNAKFFTDWREAVNRCDFVKASSIFDRWLAHMDDAFAKEYMRMEGYKRGYAERFLGRCTRDGKERVTGPRRLVAQLPDEWLFNYDPANEGVSNGWFKADFDATSWQRAKTYSSTLDDQGIPERLTWMWYRVALNAPKDMPTGPLHLWFGEVDGRQTKVWVNSEYAGEFGGSRRPGEVEISGKIKPGQENFIAIQVCHDKISELKLGGLLRPVMVYAGPKPEDAAPGK